MSLINTMFGGSGASAGMTSEEKVAMRDMLHGNPNSIISASSITGVMRKEMMHGLFPDSVGKTIFDGRLIVTKVLNGYVIQYAVSSGVQPDVYVESDLDGVNARIKTLMTTFNLESK